MKNIVGLSLVLSAGLMFAACSSDSNGGSANGDAGAAGEPSAAAGAGGEAGAISAAGSSAEGGALGGAPDMGGAAGEPAAGMGGTKAK